MSQKTAALLIIGNEILSGRTQDANLACLAKFLVERGIRLSEVRVIGDYEEQIIRGVRELKTSVDYLFTTGGIGPTHDDITSDCIAKALGHRLFRHPEAERLLMDYYPPEKRNPARMKMADVPEGCELILNPVSTAPGYKIENVFVLAGVPQIMAAMLKNLEHHLSPGQITLSKALTVHTGEADVAAALTALQQKYMQTEIGSYPFFRDGKPGTEIVFRGLNEADLQAALESLREQCSGRGFKTS